MGKIVLTPEIQGERPFRCFKCRKWLKLRVDSEQVLRLWCRRCKTRYTVETTAPLPDALALRSGIYVHQ